MLLNLYGDRGLVFQLLATGFKEAHIQDKLKFDVVEAEKVGSKFKEAVKKAFNAKYLDDADMVIRFAEAKQAEEGSDNEQSSDETGSEKEEVEVEVSADEKAETNEAQSTAAGIDLKKKIVDTIKRCLYQTDSDKIELSDLEGYMEGYNVSFLKVSFKEKEGEATSQA